MAKKMCVMNNEINYSKSVSAKHIKDLGQYFTNYSVADFMCSWVCNHAKNMLDPAVGNSVFFKHVKKHYPKCALTGYEIDKNILDYFGNSTEANLFNSDYLLNGWDNKYDAIVCNPPYNRFQAISNRNEIIENIYAHTGVKYSGYTNLYILFLIKSIFQLSDTGRLAYIIPTEFLNSKYGTPIKQLLIERRLLRAIINFHNNDEMFFNATTTCCIILLDNEEKDGVNFYNLSSVDDLKGLDVGTKYYNSICVGYNKLRASEKWRSYINQEDGQDYLNLRDISEFCSVSRGIATGANDFFCFSFSKSQRYSIPTQCLSKCICRSADIKTAIFTEADFQKLSDSDKNVYLLDVNETDASLIEDYIKFGEKNGVDKKYLPSCRKPWFSMEKKPAAPILVSSACRETIKFVRNLAGTKSLTTFHSIFVNNNYQEYTDLIFCYFLTPIAQEIIRKNRKELGNGLNKFQPNDFNTAKMLNLNIISAEDKKSVREIYCEMQNRISDTHVDQLNKIFSSYLIQR